MLSGKRKIRRKGNLVATSHKFRLDAKQWDQLAVDVRRLAANLPAERRIILQGFRETVVDAVLDQYYMYDDPAHGRHLPPAFTGDWATGLRVFIQPQLGAVSVWNTSPHAGAVEFGRSPGRVPKAVIEVWAEDKLHITDKRIVRSIWKRIVRRGFAGHHVLERATSPYAADGVGPALHEELGYILRERISVMMQKYGWRNQ